jgi:hypothetical protein
VGSGHQAPQHLAVWQSLAREDHYKLPTPLTQGPKCGLGTGLKLYADKETLSDTLSLILTKLCAYRVAQNQRIPSSDAWRLVEQMWLCLRGYSPGLAKKHMSSYLIAQSQPP